MVLDMQQLLLLSAKILQIMNNV